jgi:phosphonate metabolism-associated iron-containing alcohol dehydrogenase
MTSWRYHNPVKVRFGIDSLDEISELIGGRSYVLVTYPGEQFRAWHDRIEALSGRALLCIDCIEANPTLTLLKQICSQLAALPHQPELLVALGGGSVIDACKVLAAEHGQFDPMLAYLTQGRESGRTALPYIAIPTTAGTGSEVTCWATVWDPEVGRKLSLARSDLYAESVLVDPRLMAGLPRDATIASGLDALSHALESIWNIHANPMTRSLAIDAAQEVMSALPQVVADPSDLAARSRMAMGALRAGLAFSNTKTALAHNISYPITLKHGVAHGIACGFCLPAVMQAALGSSKECDAALARIFGDTSTAPGKLEAFLRGLGVATHPAAYGLAQQDWEQIVSDAFAGARGRNFIGAPHQFPTFVFESPVSALAR